MPAKRNGGSELRPTLIASQLEPQMRHSATNTKDADFGNTLHTDTTRTVRTL